MLFLKKNARKPFWNHRTRWSGSLDNIRVIQTVDIHSVAVLNIHLDREISLLISLLTDLDYLVMVVSGSFALASMCWIAVFYIIDIRSLFRIIKFWSLFSTISWSVVLGNWHGIKDYWSLVFKQWYISRATEVFFVKHWCVFRDTWSLILEQISSLEAPQILYWNTHTLQAHLNPCIRTLIKF